MTIFKKRFFFILALPVLSATITLKAQTFITDTILYNGNSNKFINLVFVGDGFQSTELNDYISNVRNVSNYLLSISPFLEYRNYFNVFAIRVPSLESGAVHPANASDEWSSNGQPALQVNNYFNSTFDYFSIHRLLVPQNSTAVDNILISHFPMYDQPVVLVNSAYYGGSGGFFATSSLHSNAFEILAHEIGHSFADLADEYYAGDLYAAEKDNMTQQNNPLLVKWKNWIGTDDIGIYQHCCGSNSAVWYKPHTSCKMQYLGYPFCAVCKESIIESIHRLIGSPVLSMLPTNQTPVNICAPSKFYLSLLKPIPNTSKVTWTLNGNHIADNIDSVFINPVQLHSGNNVLTALVSDTTGLSRSDTHATLHTYNTSWTITHQPKNLLGADTSVVVVCGDGTSNISGLYNTTGFNTQWDIADPTIADTGIHFLIATDINGCRDTAIINVKQQVANWTGNMSSNWHNPQNWSTSSVPNEKTHVIINGNTPFSCIISTQPAVAASIQVRPGGNYSITNNQILDIRSHCSNLPTQ